MVARWAPIVVTVVALVVAAASRSLYLANADALLPGLMSTDHLTWFYWGQDRLANVVPALAWPVQDLRWNIDVQLFLIGCGWFALTALFAANHLADRVGRAAPWAVVTATIVGAGASWAVLPPATEQILVFEQLYAFALAVFVVGMFGASRAQWRWRVPGLMATLVATLINPSLLLYSPLVLVLPGVRAFTRRGRVLVPTRQVVVPLVGAAAAFLLTSIASNRFGDPPKRETGYNEFAFDDMWDNVGDALDRVGSSSRGVVALIVVLLATHLLVFRARALSARLRVTYVGAAVFAMIWTFLFAGNKWVVTNALYPRYFFPVYAAALLYVVAAACEVIVLAQARGWTRRIQPLRPRPALRPLVAASILVAPIAGVAAVHRVHFLVLVQAEPAADLVVEREIDLVVGDYWTVWPVVIDARARGNEVLGVSDRTAAIGSQVEAAIGDDVSAGDPLTAMCLGVDVPRCVEMVNEWAPYPLDVDVLIADRPLVVRLARAG